MRFLIFIMGLFISTSLWASTPGYDLKLELSLDGKVVASPRIVVQEGKVGTLTQESGDNKIFFEIVASEGEIQGNRGILLKLKIGLINNDGSRTIISQPQILAKPGEEAHITVGQDDKEEMTLKVIATRKKWSRVEGLDNSSISSLRQNIS